MGKFFSKLRLPSHSSASSLQGSDTDTNSETTPGKRVKGILRGKPSLKISTSGLKRSISSGTREFVNSGNVSRWAIVVGVLTSYVILLAHLLLIKPLLEGRI